MTRSDQPFREPAADLIGGMDIYLLDLVLRGRIAPDARVLDAGCGFGRNLSYFMRSGRRVAGLDRDPRAVAEVRRLADSLGHFDLEAFRVETVEASTFADASFDLIISNAVLHFARDEEQFRAMTDGMARLLAPGGLVFCRLASDVGIEDAMLALPERGGRWRRMPDGSDRFVVDLDFLMAETERLGAQLEGAIKTVNVQNRRCMSTWIWSR